MPRLPQQRTTPRPSNQADRRQRGTTAERRYGSDWEALRDAYLTANPLCEQCLRENKEEPATQVDHIEPFKGRDDPKRLEWNNLQSLDDTCHNRKTRRQMSKIHLLVGPPGCGKTTYAKARMQPGDLLIDLDLLLSALTGRPVHDTGSDALPFAIAARNAVLRLLQTRGHDATAWVITSINRPEEWIEMVGSTSRVECVSFRVSQETCLERVRHRPASVAEAVASWFALEGKNAPGHALCDVEWTHVYA